MCDDEIDLSNAELYASDNRGVYIPQFFAETVIRELVHGISDEQWNTLCAGPDHEWYWETWDEVTSNAEIDLPNGKKAYLWQDGDLWIVPKE